MNAEVASAQGMTLRSVGVGRILTAIYLMLVLVLMPKIHFDLEE
jgi:hypothetical protein